MTLLSKIRVPRGVERVCRGGRFRIGKASTAPAGGEPDEDACKEELDEVAERLDDLQRALYAENRRSVLCIFQAMDAAGKDSTIRAVTRQLNPAGFQVHAFKKPSERELDHDFLWRTARALPERGRIGVFNRSYYEEVLVVRVHPEFLVAQRVEGDPEDEDFWKARYESIREHEAHLMRNGTTLLKFFLHVSKEEQRRRLLDRLDDPDKNWKFNPGDLRERALWKEYLDAYERCIRATASDAAPWWVIPADDKPFMRLRVAEILERTLQALDPRYPSLDEKTRAELPRYRAELERG